MGLGLLEPRAPLASWAMCGRPASSKCQLTQALGSARCPPNCNDSPAASIGGPGMVIQSLIIFRFLKLRIQGCHSQVSTPLKNGSSALSQHLEDTTWDSSTRCILHLILFLSWLTPPTRVYQGAAAVFPFGRTIS